ncbi:MAG: PqqD family protein [Bacteroidaceae bacterium]|nr:PqqD family protein [Bacteroidaceae bacterium]
MRLKTDLLHLNVGKDHFVIDADTGTIDMTDLYVMNEAAAYLWEQFTGRNFTPEEMAAQLAEAYDVTPTQALADVRQLLSTWDEYGLIA